VALSCRGSLNGDLCQTDGDQEIVEVVIHVAAKSGWKLVSAKVTRRRTEVVCD